MKQFRAVYFLAVSLILYSCSLGFLEDDSSSPESSHTEYDSNSDILYSYDGDNNLEWMEYYDFNSLGQCVFVKHTLPSGSVLWSTVYEWSGTDLVTSAYYGSSNLLSWFKSYAYSAGHPVMEAKYNGTSSLQSFLTWTYNGSGSVLSTGSFNASSALQWAYTHSYDSSENRTRSTCYNSSSLRSAYIDYEYDGSRRVTRAAGYGSTSPADSFYAPCELPCFPAYGGVNTKSRNSAGLSVPSGPEAPAAPALSLSDSAVSHAWTGLWYYDAYGYTSAVLNASYLPVELERSAPDYLKGHPLTAELVYDGSSRLTKKTTRWNGETVLDLSFGYDGSGYLTSLNTSGRGLLIPLRYEISYTLASGFKVPGEIRIYNESTLLQKFVYSYGAVSSADEYAKGISSISHTDGNGALVGTYTFTFADPDLTISVTDSASAYTGKFVLSYDGSGNAVSFVSYDKNGSSLWNYRFGYEGGTRVSEAVNDSNNHPDAGDFFSVESFFVDLGRFFP